MNAAPYVHGYSSRESERLTDQANALGDLLHHDTIYPAGSVVLECGCGTGAQTIFLAARNPGAQIVAVDISAASLEKARARIAAAGLSNVQFQRRVFLICPRKRALTTCSCALFWSICRNRSKL